MTALTAGFALSLSLILAIGAQNAFVLRQGLRGTHVFVVCLTCALSDAILIAAGVAGFDVLVGSFPWLVGVMKWGARFFWRSTAGFRFARPLARPRRWTPPRTENPGWAEP